MWRWSALVVLIVLCENQISSEIITNNSNNERTPRQLVFADSCSCEDLDKSVSRRDARYSDAMISGNEDFLRSRDLDDCPCRSRDADTQGASSMLFPNTMRSVGSFLRPTEKKDDLKPFFNPEVDLASSVLKTLRIATDEEYEDALARDVAKSAARAVENDMFGDTVPQESANIITVVVSPKNVNSDDFIPQASNKHSRCLHPLERTSNSLLPLNLFRSSHERPRSILNRNSYNIDNDVGASNIQEHVASLDENKDFSMNTSPVKRINHFESDPSFAGQSKSQSFRSSPLFQRIRDKTISSLSNVPRSVINHFNNDLDTAPSVVQEQASKVPLYRSNSNYERANQDSRPLSLTNLLNLRDVELIPLKDLISKRIKNNKLKRTKILQPSPDVLSTETLEDMHTNTKYAINDDTHSSPSVLNLNIITNKETAANNLNTEKDMLGNDNKASTNEPFTRQNIDAPTNVKYPMVIRTNSNEISWLQNENDIQDSSRDISQKRDESLETQNIEPNNFNTDNKNYPTPELVVPSLVDKTVSKLTNYVLKKQEDLNNLKNNLTNVKMFNSEKEDIPIKSRDKKFDKNVVDELHVLKNSNENVEIPMKKKLPRNEEGNTMSSADDNVEDREAANTSSINNTEDNGDSQFSPSNINTQVVVKDAKLGESCNIAVKSLDVVLPVDHKQSKATSSNEEDQGRDANYDPVNLISPLEARSSESINIVPDVQNVGENNESTHNQVNDEPQILHPIDKSISTLKNYILKRQEDFKTIFKQKTKSTENQDEVALAQITTPKVHELNNEFTSFTTATPNLLDNELQGILSTPKSNSDISNECVNVSMQDLQKMSDSILQQEEHDTKKIEYPADMVKVKEPMTSNLRSSPSQDLDDSASTFVILTAEPKYQDMADEESVKKRGMNDLLLHPRDNSADEDNIPGLTSMSSPVLNLSKTPLRDGKDSIKWSLPKPLNVIEEMKARLANLFDKNERITEPISLQTIKNSEYVPLDGVKLKENSVIGSRSSDPFDLNISASTESEVTSDKFNNFQDRSNEINSCKTSMAARQTENNVEASNTVLNVIPKETDVQGLLATSNSVINLLKNPLSTRDDTLNLPAFDSMPGVKMSSNLLNEDGNGLDIAYSPVRESLSETLNPEMAIDTSTSKLQLKRPLKLLEDLNLDILKLRPESNIIKSLSKAATDLIPEPTNLKSALENKHSNILQRSKGNTEDLDDIFKVRSTLNDLQDRLTDPVIKATDSIKSTIKNAKNTFESNLKDHLVIGSKSLDPLDGNNSESTESVVDTPSDKFNNFQDSSNEINSCKTSMAARQTDNNVETSNTVLNVMPKETDVQGLLTTSNSVKNLLKKPLQNGDTINLPTFDSMPGWKMTSNLLNENGLDNGFSPVRESQSETLNPDMAIDASTSKLQLKRPLKLLEDLNLDVLKLSPESNIIRSLSKAATDLFPKPTKLKSALENKRSNILQRSQGNIEDLGDMFKVRSTLSDLRDRLTEPAIKTTDSIKSTFKNAKNTFESKLRKLNNNNFDPLRNSIKNSPSLLDTFSQNNEDIHDKLRAIHVDFNDRLESVRNDLFDRTNLLTSRSSGIRPNFRSSSNKENKSKQSKQQRSKNKESLASSSPKKATERISTPRKANEQNKFRMLDAASVPVPKTIKVPELRAASADSSLLNLQRRPSIIPVTKDSVFKNAARDTQENKNLRTPNPFLRNSNKPDTKVIISFSTTPRPEEFNGNKLKNPFPQTIGTRKGKFHSRKVQEDHSGSPSEIKQTKVAAPYNQFDNLNLRKLKSNELPSMEKDRLPKDNLQSWPRITESTFISKVQEALRARLANANLERASKPSLPADTLKRTKLPDLTSTKNKVFIGRQQQNVNENEDLLQNRLRSKESEFAPNLKEAFRTRDVPQKIRLPTDDNMKMNYFSDPGFNLVKSVTENKELLDHGQQKQAKTKNLLQSWPRATKSDLLSKVTELLKARADGAHLIKSQLPNLGERKQINDVKIFDFPSDMAKSASDNKEIVDTTLRENVSYKCKMICSKD